MPFIFKKDIKIKIHLFLLSSQIKNLARENIIKSTLLHIRDISRKPRGSINHPSLTGGENITNKKSTTNNNNAEIKNIFITHPS